MKCPTEIGDLLHDFLMNGPAEIPHEVFLEVQNLTDVSDNTVVCVAQAMHRVGFKTQPNLRESLKEETAKYDKYYKTVRMEMEVKDKVNKGKTILAWKDVTYCEIDEITEVVKREGGIVDSVTFSKFGCDGGQNSLKITLNIIEDPDEKKEKWA